MPNNRRDKNLDNSKITSDNVEQLELIKIDVEQVNKKIKDISTFAQKQISVLQREFERSLEKINKETDKTTQSYKEQVKHINQISDEMKEIVNTERQSNKEQSQRRQQRIREVAEKDIEQVKSYNQYQAQRRDAIKNFDFQGLRNLNFERNQQQKSERLQSNLDSALEEFIKSDQGPNAQKNWENALKEFTKGTEEIDSSAANFKLSSSLIKSGVDILKSFFTMWLKRFDQSIDKISSTYEEIYQKQAVLANINEAQYQELQKDMAENIKQMGLQDNLAVTQVMTATSEYISRGITDFGTAQEMGMTSAIGKVLTPYLDTQSDAYISLSQTMSPKFIKSLMGMGNYISDNVGQNRFIIKNLDTMVSDMQYMTLAARKSLMSESDQKKLEQLMLPVEEGGAGMTMEQATEYYTNMSDIFTNRGKALESGNLEQQVLAANMNVTDLESAFRESARYRAQIYGGLDTETPWGQLEYDAVRNTTGDSATGYNVSSGQALENLAKIAAGEGPTVKNSTITEDSEQTYQDMIKRFEEGQYTTAKEEKDILAENLAVNFAIYKEKWPDLFDAIKNVGSTIVSAIALWVGSKLIGGGIGKGIGALAGSAGGGTGSGILASMGGGVALGTIAGVAAVAAISTAIDNSLREGQGEHGEREQEAEVNGQFEIDDTLKSLGNVAAQNSQDKDNGWFANVAKSVSTAFGATWMGIKKLGHAIGGADYDKDYEERNAEFYTTMVSQALLNADNDRNRTGYLLAYAYLLNEINSLGTMEKLGSPITKEQLKEYANGPEFEYYNIEKYAKDLINAGYAPSGYNHEKADDPNIKNYLRVGLDRIPYDNYPAILHKDEAVLTKDAASYLRSTTKKDISKLEGVKDAVSSEVNTTNTTNNVLSQATTIQKEPSTYSEIYNNNSVSSPIIDYSSIVTTLNNNDRSNREGLNIISSTITNQTNMIISKLDKIITVVSSNGKVSSYNNRFINLESGGF